MISLFTSNTYLPVVFTPQCALTCPSAMLFLLFLFCPLLCQSECPDCKDVSGPGPLAGLYQLAGTGEERCEDLCKYEKDGELYCFERRQSEYETRYGCAVLSCIYLRNVRQVVRVRAVW